MTCSLADIFNYCGNLAPKGTEKFGSFSGRGMHFDLHTYDFDSSVHISLLKMRAFASLMNMTSLICTPYGKNLPIYSLDLIQTFGKTNAIIEVYDTIVGPVNLSRMNSVKERYSALKDKKMEPRWYDSLHMSPTCSKIGSRPSCEQLASEMTATYADLISEADPCEQADKSRRNCSYVNELISHGGPAINTIKKILGPQDTEVLFREHIFGVQEGFPENAVK